MKTNNATYRDICLKMVIIQIFLVIVISGCGGSVGGGGGTSQVAQKGIFIDNTVQGLEYRSGAYAGVTDSEGSYSFSRGESVNFFIGNVMLGKAQAKPTMTPLDLVEDAVDENHQAVVNIARFLQSLDTDGDIDDAINISGAVRASLRNAQYINFNQTPEDFTTDDNVKAIFKELNTSKVFTNGERELRGAAEAAQHLKTTLNHTPTIVVKSPNGKEFISSNSSFEITWKANANIENVTILLSLDGGATWNQTPVVESTANDGNFTWDSIPVLINNTHCRIRIIDLNNPAVYDDSNGDFTILWPMDDLAKIILASEGSDRDRDHLPDDLEEVLGTDPDYPDSDKDGIGDYEEIMGGQSFGSYDLIPDFDQDGIIAALDNDDDGNGINDGEGIDTDGDGIFNYLEINGYTYNWFTDSYALWDGLSFDEPYFKTDPLQVSTDQDPYSDSMEASGKSMDVLIDHPGSLPMVPAYPNIVVKLEGYMATLNGEVTFSEGSSMSEGATWNRELGREESTTWTHGWQVGGGAALKLGDDTGIEANGSYSGSWAGTNTYRQTSSWGGSSTSEINWQKATSSNPAAAARIKLKLKVYNYGTAAASNILPTLTMKIGGINVLTFQPANPINILEPGGVYPPDEGTYWVVEKVESMDTEPYIHITMEEFRAIESGAPVTIAITQMSANVMLMNTDGQWESAGLWGEYMARCKAVSSNIHLEINNQSFLHYLVYSDNRPSSPVVTLKDALTWVAGAHIRSDGTLGITYLDEFGRDVSESLDGWQFMFDTNTLLNNGFTGDVQALQPPGDEPFNMENLVLGPGSTIIARAPRATDVDAGPKIHYANLDTRAKKISALTTDSRGITSVSFRDKDGFDYAMVEEVNNSGIYSLSTVGLVNGEEYITDCSVDSPICPEKVIVISTDGLTTEKNITLLKYPEKDPVVPDIQSVSLDIDGGQISARIDPETIPDNPVNLEVWAHWGGDKDSRLNMERSIEFWDPSEANMWYAEIPALTWPSNVAELADTLVIAQDISTGLYDTMYVGSNILCSDCPQGSGEVYAQFRYFGVYWDWISYGIDFTPLFPYYREEQKISLWGPDSHRDSGFISNKEVIWTITMDDCTLCGNAGQGLILYFNAPWWKFSSGTHLSDVSPGEIASLLLYNPGSACSGGVLGETCENDSDVVGTYLIYDAENDRHVVFEVERAGTNINEFSIWVKFPLAYKYVIY